MNQPFSHPELITLHTGMYRALNFIDDPQATKCWTFLPLKAWIWGLFNSFDSCKDRSLCRAPSLILLKIETFQSLLSPIRVNTDGRFSTWDDCSLSNTNWAFSLSLSSNSFAEMCWTTDCLPFRCLEILTSCYGIKPSPTLETPIEPPTLESFSEFH